MIAQFVLSLPKPSKLLKEDPLTEETNGGPNAEGSNNHNDYHHHGRGQDQEDGAGYFSKYGLGQDAWGS